MLLAHVIIKLFYLLILTVAMNAVSCKRPAKVDPSTENSDSVIVIDERSQQPEQQTTFENAMASTAAARPAIAGHLGFATRVPADVSCYLSIPDASAVADGIVQFFYQLGIVARFDEEQDSGQAKTTRGSDFAETLLPKDALDYIGSSAFIFVGADAADQAHVLALGARELEADVYEELLSGLFQSFEEPEGQPDSKEAVKEHAAEMIGPLVEAIARDGRIRLPSVVMGWKPAINKRDECLRKVALTITGICNQKTDIAVPVNFQAAGVQMNGWKVPVAKMLDDDAKAEMEKAGKELLETIDDSPLTYFQAAQLIKAITDFELVVASGEVDGYVLIYLGNGIDGFQLAEKPEQSLAATDALRWSTPLSKWPIRAAAYLSKDAVQSTLPLLDFSSHWTAVAAALPNQLKELIKVDLAHISSIESRNERIRI